jgi:hypothetical protein
MFTRERQIGDLLKMCTYVVHVRPYRFQKLPFKYIQKCPITIPMTLITSTTFLLLPGWKQEPPLLIGFLSRRRPVLLALSSSFLALIRWGPQFLLADKHRICPLWIRHLFSAFVLNSFYWLNTFPKSTFSTSLMSPFWPCPRFPLALHPYG